MRILFFCYCITNEWFFRENLRFLRFSYSTLFWQFWQQAAGRQVRERVKRHANGSAEGLKFQICTHQINGKKQQFWFMIQFHLHFSHHRLLCRNSFEQWALYFFFEIFLDLFWFFDFSAASNYWSSAGGRELRIRITQSDCQLFPNSADFHCGLWKAKRRISEIRKN